MTHGSRLLCDYYAPLARHAESARPPMRSSSTSARRFNCGQTGHLRSTCRAPLRSIRWCLLAGVLDSGRQARRAPMRMLFALAVRVPSVLYAARRPTWRGFATTGRQAVDAHRLGVFRQCISFLWIVLRCGFRLHVTTHLRGISLLYRMRLLPRSQSSLSLQVFFRGPVV